MTLLTVNEKTCFQVTISPNISPNQGVEERHGSLQDKVKFG